MAVILRKMRSGADGFVGLPPFEMKVRVGQTGYFQIDMPKEVGLALHQNDNHYIYESTLGAALEKLEEDRASYNLLQTDSKLVIRYYAANNQSSQDGHGTGIRLWWGVYKRIEHNGRPKYYQRGGMILHDAYSRKELENAKEMAHTTDREMFFLGLQSQMESLRGRIQQVFDHPFLWEEIDRKIIDPAILLGDPSPNNALLLSEGDVPVIHIG